MRQIFFVVFFGLARWDGFASEASDRVFERDDGVHFRLLEEILELFLQGLQAHKVIVQKVEIAILLFLKDLVLEAKPHHLVLFGQQLDINVAENFQKVLGKLLSHVHGNAGTDIEEISAYGIFVIIIVSGIRLLLKDFLAKLNGFDESEIVNVGVGIALCG